MGRFINWLSGDGWKTDEEVAIDRANAIDEEREKQAKEYQNQVNSAFQTMNYENMTGEEMYKYMATNDPENQSAYYTNMASLKAQREMRDTQVASQMQQLKENGINPLLAASSIGGASGAGYSAVSDAGQQTSQRAVADQNNLTKTLIAQMQANSKLTNTMYHGLFSTIQSVIGGAAKIAGKSKQDT